MRWGAVSEWRKRTSSLYMPPVEGILDAIQGLPIQHLPGLRRGLLDIGLVVDDEDAPPDSGVREPRTPAPIKPATPTYRQP